MSYIITVTSTEGDFPPARIYEQSVETLDLPTLIHVVNHPPTPPRKTRRDKGTHKEQV